MLHTLKEHFLHILICGGLGYGIQYICNCVLGFSLLWGWPIYIYPILLCFIYIFFKVIGKILFSIKDIFFTSMDVSDFFKSSSTNKRRHTKKCFTRYDHLDGKTYYQEGDSLTDTDGNIYHKGGDNVWRDYKGNSVDDTRLN